MKANVINQVSRLFILLLLVFGFSLFFLCEGGHIQTLIQPIGIAAVTLLTYSFSAWNLGIKTTNGQICSKLFKHKDSEIGESLENGQEVTFRGIFAATHLVGVGYWLIIIQNITAGSIVIGRLFSALIVVYLYGILLMTLSNLDREYAERTLAILGTAIMASIPGIIVCIKFV